MRAISERIDDVELMLTQQACRGTRSAPCCEPTTLDRSRFLELHRERLRKRLDAERLAADLVERILVGLSRPVAVTRAQPSMLMSRPRAAPVSR